MTEVNDVNEVLNWMDGLCEEASRDIALANRLARQSTAFTDYFTNVYKIKSMNREAWPYWRPSLFSEAVRMYNEYLLTEQTHQAAGQVNDIAARLASLEEMVRKLVEVQTPKQQQALAEATDDTDEDENAEDTETEDDADPSQEEPAEPAADPDAEEATEDEESEGDA